MPTTKQQQEQGRDEFADQFDATDAPPEEISEDAAFGIEPEGGVDAAAEQEPAAEANAEPDAKAEQEARLRDWEAQLKAKEDELAAREASLETANVDNKQTTTGPPSDGEPGDGAGGATDADKGDPAKILAEDFGQEFVDLLGRLIENKVKEHLGSGLSGMQGLIDSIIDHLNSQQNQAHGKAIKAVHADFVEVIQSPEFEAYRADQTPAEQQDIDRVVASGTADEIIEMLNKFKQAKGIDGDDFGASFDHDAIDAAEGVRSGGGGLRIPDKASTSTSYEDSWNEL